MNENAKKKRKKEEVSGGEHTEKNYSVHPGWAVTTEPKEENSLKVRAVCRANTSHWLMIVHGESLPSLTTAIEFARSQTSFSLVEYL